MKKPITRVRSKSVPLKRNDSLPSITNKPLISKGTTFSKAPITLRPSPKCNKLDVNHPQCILLTSGNLELALNFPSDAVVKFREKNKETVLMNGLCFCKSPSSQVC